MKKRKTIIALLLVAIIGLVGLTIAYFSNSTTIDNLFSTKEYGTTYTEEFNEDCFNNMADKIIIGEIDENGNKNNNVIKFILKTGKNYDFLIDSQKYCMSFRKRNK